MKGDKIVSLFSGIVMNERIHKEDQGGKMDVDTHKIKIA